MRENPASTKEITREYFDSLLLEMRLMDSCVPKTELGALAVSVGIHLIPYVKQGAEAVADRMNAMTEELKGTMAYTGVKDLGSFDSSVLHRL